MIIQGGSNMTGTDLCVNKPVSQSRSYLNHLVHILATEQVNRLCSSVLYTTALLYTVTGM